MPERLSFFWHLSFCITQDPRRAVDLFHVVVPALGLVCPRGGQLVRLPKDDPPYPDRPVKRQQPGRAAQARICIFHRFQRRKAAAEKVVPPALPEDRKSVV